MVNYNKILIFVKSKLPQKGLKDSVLYMEVQLP